MRDMQPQKPVTKRVKVIEAWTIYSVDREVGDELDVQEPLLTILLNNKKVELASVSKKAGK